MKLPADTYTRIDDAVVAEARFHTDVVREFLADLQVQYPAAIGLIGGLVGTLAGFVVSGTNLQVTAPLLAMSLIGGIVVVIRQRKKNALMQRAYVSITEAYLAYTAERDANRQLSATQERQLQWLLAITVMLERAIAYVVQAKADSGRATLEDARKVCYDILDKLVEIRHLCLRYVPDDPTYNLHIFRYVESEEKELVGFARRCGAGIAQNNRKWRLGIGHAGRCFEDGEMMILSDLQGVEGEGYRRQSKPTDEKLYRAIIDVPIRNGGGKKWGVLAITSGTPDQFSKGDFAPLSVVSQILGVVVAVTSDAVASSQEGGTQ